MCGGDPIPRYVDTSDKEVFPACAGVILVAEQIVRQIGGVPRMCGGDPLQDGGHILVW